MWMNATSGWWALTCSAMSTTGPQTRLGHSRGLANRIAIGRLPKAEAKSTACMSSGGSRVSIRETSPRTDAAVGVWMGDGRWPTAGTAARQPTRTAGPMEAAATSRWSSRTTPSTW
jgi:hypothetical protein